MTNARKREESLIERAAQVYDFGAHLRRRDVVPASEPEAPAQDPVATRLLADDPVALPPAADDPVDATVPEAAPHDQPSADDEPLDLTFDLLAAAPPAPEGAEALSPMAAATPCCSWHRPVAICVSWFCRSIEARRLCGDELLGLVALQEEKTRQV